MGAIGDSIVSFVPIDEPDLNALKGRSDTSGAVVILEKKSLLSKSSKLKIKEGGREQTN